VGHGADYYIVDPERTCVKSAKWQLAALERLLENDAAEAKRVIGAYTPDYPSFRAYLDAIDDIYRDTDGVVYNKDGSATVAAF
jgi:hypothetical protein